MPPMIAITTNSSTRVNALRTTARDLPTHEVPRSGEKPRRETAAGTGTEVVCPSFFVTPGKAAQSIAPPASRGRPFARGARLDGNRPAVYATCARYFEAAGPQSERMPTRKAALPDMPCDGVEFTNRYASPSTAR